MSFGGMLTGGEEEAPKEDKTVSIETSEDKEIANNIKVNE
jgi:Na+-transporting NADH:ubiquinone oxidoreductase subunit E